MYLMQHRTLAENMLVIQFYYVARLFFKDFANIFWLIFIIFEKLETAIFKDHLSVQGRSYRGAKRVKAAFQILAKCCVLLLLSQ